mmetsp:Transcript_41111/g.98636  ORF Transcript_41111/g.98636 Transcript_41111/m.98636 type:complete len:374 (+) Transcript_41111:388-1509(+)
MLSEIPALVALPVLVHPPIHALVVCAVIRHCPRSSCGCGCRSSGSILHCQTLLNHARIGQLDHLCQWTLFASPASHRAILLEPILVAKTRERRTLPATIVLRFPPPNTELICASFIRGFASVAGLPAIQLRPPRPVGASFFTRHSPFADDSSIRCAAIVVFVHPVGVIGAKAGGLVVSSRGGGRRRCGGIRGCRCLRRGVPGGRCRRAFWGSGGGCGLRGGRGLRRCGGFLRRSSSGRCCCGHLLLAGDIVKAKLQLRSGVLKNCTARRRHVGAHLAGLGAQIPAHAAAVGGVGTPPGRRRCVAVLAADHYVAILTNAASLLRRRRLDRRTGAARLGAQLVLDLVPGTKKCDGTTAVSLALQLGASVRRHHPV